MFFWYDEGMVKILSAGITSLVVMLGMDFVWLGIVAKKFYGEQIGSLMKSQMDWLAVVGVYVLLVVGVLAFVVLPNLESGSLVRVLMMGALFGFVTYGVYDLTNMATLKNWTYLMVVVDMLWGMFLCGVASGVGYWVGRML